MSTEQHVGFVPFDFTIEEDQVALTLAHVEPIVFERPEEGRARKDFDVKLGRPYYLSRPLEHVVADLEQPSGSPDKHRIGYLKSEIDRAYDSLQQH